MRLYGSHTAPAVRQFSQFGAPVHCHRSSISLNRGRRRRLPDQPTLVFRMWHRRHARLLRCAILDLHTGVMYVHASLIRVKARRRLETALLRNVVDCDGPVIGEDCRVMVSREETWHRSPFVFSSMSAIAVDTQVTTFDHFAMILSKELTTAESFGLEAVSLSETSETKSVCTS